MQETWLGSLSQEDLLEKEMVTHSSILAWEIPCIAEPGGLHTVHGVAKSQIQLKQHSTHTWSFAHRTSPMWTSLDYFHFTDAILIYCTLLLFSVTEQAGSGFQTLKLEE